MGSGLSRLMENVIVLVSFVVFVVGIAWLHCVLSSVMKNMVVWAAETVEGVCSYLI